jgi:hypothetical protein
MFRNNDALLFVVLVILIWLTANAVTGFCQGLLRARHDLLRIEAYNRAYYQWLINWCISLMSHPEIDEDQSDELQWMLHSLLYEYRTQI